MRGLAWRLSVLVPAVLALLGGAAGAQPGGGSETLHIQRVSTPPALEDYIDGTPEVEPSITTLYQREPGDGQPASQPTEVYLSYDDTNLYAVFVARDSSPEQIRARLAKREAIFGDDAIGLLLDTFHDRRRSYLFLTNPLGIQLDGIVTEGQDDDYSFDTLWYSEGTRTSFGYVVRFAIPFKSLRFPDRPRQTWGIAVGRIIPRTNETAFWPYITRRLAGLGQQLATLTGLHDISPGRNLQFIPYAAFAAARFLDADVPAFDADRDGRAGVDAKVVVQDAFTIDLTVNPDFSQVESDEPQVTVNQRFEVFFPERRPFFIENAAFFETPVNLLFTRRIRDPQVGGRVTGKAGGWALGAIGIDDRAPGQLVDAGHPVEGDRTGIGVVRLQREFGQQSSVGVFASARDFGPSSSRVGSVDGRLTVGPNWVLSGQAVVSATRTLDAESLDGTAFLASARRSGRDFSYAASYLDLAPDFRVPLGFVRRVDLRQVEQFAQYRWRPNRRLVSFGPRLFGLVQWDHARVLQDWEVNPGFGVEFTGQTWMEVEHEQRFERFEQRGFRKHSTSLAFGTAWLNWLDVFARVSTGREINFLPAPGLEPFLADDLSATAAVTLRPVPNLQFDQRYLYVRLRTPSVDVFTNHIVRSRANYQFSRELSLRAIVDYNGVLPNPAVVDLERTRRFTADVLLTYLLNPGTAVYVGYTDSYQNLDLQGGALRRTSSLFHPAGRQFFVKSSYLFRF